MPSALELRRDYRIGVGLLLGLNLILAFGVIGLLVRLRPAIERIFDRNVVSIQSAETMLGILAEYRDPAGEEARATRFREARARANEHISMPEELPLLETIAEDESAALAGDRDAVESVLSSARELIRLNRAAAQEADRRASRAATAGAWAAVFIAMVSFLASIAVFRRLARRLIEPLEELRAVLDASRAGNPHRRCRVFPGSDDVTGLLTAINDLLDRASQRAGGNERERRNLPNTLARTALAEALDARSVPSAIFDANGDLFAASDSALAYLSTEEGARARKQAQAAIRASSDDSSSDEKLHSLERVELSRLRDGIGWLAAFETSAPAGAPAGADEPG